MIALLVACTNPSETRPDVVLVTLDTTRADRLQPYGGTAPTPALAQLAADGRRFDQAWSPIPLTIPAHASLLTGLYPPHTGVRDQVTAVPPALGTLAEQLHGDGYLTAGFVGAFVTSRVFRFEQGFDVFDDELHGRDERAAPDVVAPALAWEQASRGDARPRFAWVHLYDPHLPNQPIEGHPDPYESALVICDQAVGQLRAAFTRRPTLFVVVGDHGESQGEHDEAAHGLFVYPATQRVPWVMAGPGIPAGDVVSTPVSLVDVAPTVLAAVGAPALPRTDGVVVPADPRPVYLESWQLAERFGLAPHVGLVDGDELLVDVPRPELYELAADRGASHDRAAEKPDRVAALKAELAALAMAPPGPPASGLDPQQVAQLASLGYVAPAPVPEGALPDPKDAHELLVTSQRADTMMLDGQLADAEPLLAEAVARWPKAWELHAKRGWALAGLGRPAEASAELHAALALNPTDPQLQVALASELAAQGRFDQAEDVLQAVAKATPTVPRIQEMSVLALLDGGHPDQAEQLARSYLVDRPQDPNLSGLLGVALAWQNRLDEAAPLLELGISVDQPEPHVLFTFSAMWAGRGDRGRAVALLDRELQVRPGSPQALIARCSFHHQDHETDALRALAEPLLARNPNDPAAQSCEAAALLESGDVDGARALVSRVLAVAPDLPLAKQVAGELSASR